jgi:hypothetical protein
MLGARDACQDDAAWTHAIEIEDMPPHEDEDCWNEIVGLVGLCVGPLTIANHWEIEWKFCSGSRTMQRPLEEMFVLVLAKED